MSGVVRNSAIASGCGLLMLLSEPPQLRVGVVDALELGELEADLVLRDVAD